MRGLVLSGGGAHGDFQLGAIAYLYQQGLLPDLIVGCSIGAIHGAKLAEGHTDPRGITGAFGGGIGGGYEPLPPQSDLEVLFNIWMSLEDTADFWIKRPWYERLLRALESVRGHAGDLESQLGDLGGVILTAVHPIYQIVSIVAVATTLSDLDDIQDILSDAAAAGETSIYDLAPIARRLNEELNPAAAARSGILLRLVVVELESGQVRYVTENATFEDDGTAVDLGLPGAVLASAAIPFYFPAVRLNDRTFVDGGVREILPVQKAVELGADEIWAISASPISPTEWSLPSPTRDVESSALLSVALRAISLNTTETRANEANPTNGWPVPVNLIAPTFSVHSSREIVPELIRINLDYGWMRAEDLLATLRAAMREEAQAGVVGLTARESFGPFAGVGGPRLGPRRISPSPALVDLTPFSAMGLLGNVDFRSVPPTPALPPSSDCAYTGLPPRIALPEFAETSDAITRLQVRLFRIGREVEKINARIAAASRRLREVLRRTRSDESDESGPEDSARREAARERYRRFEAMQRLRVAELERERVMLEAMLGDAVEARLRLGLHMPRFYPLGPPGSD